MGRAVQAAALATSGLLAGNELATLIALHPALRTLPLDGQVAAEQALTRRLGQVMPAYMVATVAATAAASADRSGGPDDRLRHGALAASLLMLATTLAGNLPLNAQTLAYDSAAGPAGWARLRGRWERLHRVRVLLDLAAFAALTAAALRDERSRRR